MVTEIELFESPDLIPFDFCLWRLMQNEIYKKKGGYTRRSARSHFGCSKRKLGRVTRDLCARVAWCIEADGGIFEHLHALWTVTDFDVLLNAHLSIFISVINQLDAQDFCFTISLFHASTCFEHMSRAQDEMCTRRPPICMMIPEAV